MCILQPLEEIDLFVFIYWKIRVVRLMSVSVHAVAVREMRL